MSESLGLRQAWGETLRLTMVAIRPPVELRREFRWAMRILTFGTLVIASMVLSGVITVPLWGAWVLMEVHAHGRRMGARKARRARIMSH